MFSCITNFYDKMRSFSFHRPEDNQVNPAIQHFRFNFFRQYPVHFESPFISNSFKIFMVIIFIWKFFHRRMRAGPYNLQQGVASMNRCIIYSIIKLNYSQSYLTGKLIPYGLPPEINVESGCRNITVFGWHHMTVQVGDIRCGISSVP